MSKAKRLWSVMVLLVVAGLLLALLAGLFWVDNERNRGIAYGEPPGPNPYAAGSLPQGGVNAYFLHLDTPEDIARTLDMMRDAGLHFVRVHFPWESIEDKRKGNFTWEVFDYIVDQAKARGLELLIRLDRPPGWARQQALQSPLLQEQLRHDPGATGPPDRYEDYGDFVAAVVTRYKERGGRFYQLWNEPNYRHEWNYEEPSAARFAELLRVGYERAKAADPEAVIVGPSLTPADGKDWRAHSDMDYLDALYRAGGARYFDIMSVQLYGLGQPPDEHRYVRLPWKPGEPLRKLAERPLDTRTDVSRVVLLREIMERHGDGAKAVWVSEFGWNTAPFSENWGPPVSEELKGDYIVGLMRRARQEWPWMGPMYIWFLRRGGPEPDPADPTPYFALVRRDWQPLPAYNAVKDYLTAPPVVGPGVYRLDSGIARQEGELRSVRFWGSTAELRLPPGTRTPIGVDGQGPWPFDPDPGGGYVPVGAVGLALGEHTLTIHAPLPGDTLLRIQRDQPLPWLWWLLPALLLGLLWLVVTRLLWLLYGGAPQRMRLALGWMRPRGPWGAGGGSPSPMAPAGARAGLDARGASMWRRIWSRAGGALLLVAQGLALAAVYRLSPHLLPTALATLAFGLLALPRPDLALLYIPLTLPLYQRGKGFWDGALGIQDKFIPLHELVIVVLVGVTALWWLAGGLDQPPLRRPPGPRSLPPGPARRRWLRRWLPVLLFVVAGVVGVLVAPPESRRAAAREWRWVIAEPLACYVLIHVWGRRLALARPLAWALIAGGAVVALVGVLQLRGINLAPQEGVAPCFSSAVEQTGGVQRATSVYCHSNNLGLYLGRIWPLAAALAWWAYRVRKADFLNHGDTARSAPDALELQDGAAAPTTTRRAPWWLAALLWASCAGLILLGLAASFSKGALLGAAIAGLALASQTTARRWVAPLATICALAFLLAAVAGPERLSLFGESSALRLSVWASALRMARDHPVAGIGLDQFYYYYNPEFGRGYIGEIALANNELYTAHAHNVVLDMLLRLGPLGLATFLWLAARTLHQSRAGWRRGGPTAPLQLGIFGATLAGLAHGMVDHGYFTADLAAYFWIALALTELAGRDDTHPRNLPPPRHV